MRGRRMYLVLIALTLVVLPGLVACAPGWMQPGSGGMMGGQGGSMMGPQQPGQQPSQGQPYPNEPAQPYPYGPGDGMGPGMMGDMPMMGGMTGYYSEVTAPLSHDEAKAITDEYLASTNNLDLTIDEFEEYSHNFYVSLIEKNTGRGAIEIIIDRYSGSLQPEPQSMMWNGKYGMMGQSQTTQMMVTSEQALKIAQDFLDVVYPGTGADEIVPYYGYYTIMTTLEGEHYGMLSINGYSGDVWYHTWHGMFISEVEEHAAGEAGHE